MNYSQNLQKWGNSTGIRLPKKVLEAAQLAPDQAVSISLRGGSIVLTPVKPNDDFTLETMLVGVTPDKVGAELDWGPEVGAEKLDA